MDKKYEYSSFVEMKDNEGNKKSIKISYTETDNSTEIEATNGKSKLIYIGSSCSDKEFKEINVKLLNFYK